MDEMQIDEVNVVEDKSSIISKETFNLILLLDNSYSMTVDGRIDQLNHAVPKLKESLMQVADAETVDVKVRILSFGDDAKWLQGSYAKGEDIGTVVWQDLEADGNTTRTNLAIREANYALKKEYLGARALRPVVILVTDGYCNPEECHDDYLLAIEEMKKKLSGGKGKEKVTRIAIGVQGSRREELEEFASIGIYHDIEQPLIFEVDKAEDIVKVINFVVVSSMYSSIADNGDNTPVVLAGDPDEEDFV